MTQEEQEVGVYLLSNEYFQWLIDNVGEEEAKKSVFNFRTKKHVLLDTTRRILARQVEENAGKKLKSIDPWKWQEDDSKTGRQIIVTSPPYGWFYFYFFLDEILKTTASNIYPYLERECVGDLCDRIYLTSLLDRMESEGYFDETRIMNWISGLEHIEQLDVEPGHKVTIAEMEKFSLWRYFRGSDENRKRADIVRRWIAEKAALEQASQATTLTETSGADQLALVIVDTERLATEKNYPIVFDQNFDSDKCSQLAFEIGLTTADDKLKPEVKVGSIAGMVCVLVYEGYCHKQQQTIKSLMGRYGKPYNKTYSPDRDKNTGALPREFRTAACETAKKLERIGGQVLKRKYSMGNEDWYRAKRV